jgi:hypothetical protein
VFLVSHPQTLNLKTKTLNHAWVLIKIKLVVAQKIDIVLYHMLKYNYGSDLVIIHTCPFIFLWFGYNYHY